MENSSVVWLGLHFERGHWLLLIVAALLSALAQGWAAGAGAFLFLGFFLYFYTCCKAEAAYREEHGLDALTWDDIHERDRRRREGRSTLDLE